MVRYILKGSAEFILNGKSFYVHEKQVIYIPEGCYLECHALEDYFEFISIRFKVTTQLATDNFFAGVLPYPDGKQLRPAG